MGRGQRGRRLSILWLAWLLLCPPVARAAQSDGIPELLARLQAVLESKDVAAYLDLLGPAADRPRAALFTVDLDPDTTRAVVREVDRRPLGTSGEGLRLMVEVFQQAGDRARIETWRLDVRRKTPLQEPPPGVVPEWTIVSQEVLNALQGLHRLALNPSRQYAARHLSILSEDFELKLDAGSVFVAETTSGVTGMVLLGVGEMLFSPSSATERGQLKIFCGEETFRTRFDAAYVRMNPAEFEERVARDGLRELPVETREFQRAQAVFKDEMEKTFVVDLSGLSDETWSLTPPLGDFVAEIRTMRYATLTYARSATEPEDISLFDRANKRNISIYTSQQKLASRGRFYDEDARVDYDVQDYYVDTIFNPLQGHIQGRTRMRLRVKTAQLATVSFRLADSLNVRSIVSDELGRLLFLRVRNQDTVVVNLPETLHRDDVITLTATYSGPLAPQSPDREAVQVVRYSDDIRNLDAEPSYLYSNRANWYLQSPVTDYATATLRLTVPAAFSCVASGELVEGSPVTVGTGNEATKVFVFTAKQPLRYLAAVVSRFVQVSSEQVKLPLPDAEQAVPGGATGNGPDVGGAAEVQIRVEANPRHQSRAQPVTERTADVMRFYTSLIGDCPYPSFTVAVVESDVPGGHSPAYFAALNQPLPTGGLVWRNDPAAFDNFPEFYLAHEVAHQWWGQAVGWKNFHEQWLSEGFSQYFAALYGHHIRGGDVFAGIVKHMRRWAVNESDEGPVYLGYRLGHVKNEGRIFRALVYNKGAGVLHMLRRFLGDEVFFRGLRRFYGAWQFKKAGTDDLRQVLEAESGISLERFFERWIYDSKIPEVRYSYRVSDRELVVRFVQSEVFDFPVTVTIEYDDRTTSEVVVRVSEQITEQRIELARRARNVQINRDDAALVNFRRE